MRELLGVERIDAGADKAYHEGEDIAAGKSLGIIPYVIRPHRGPANPKGYYPKVIVLI
ncbi:MAG: hypothetical protein QHC67_17250 [Sphingobium sp.]|uniref:hypothetical protein n=1 Tax=Sphingobium sp. TaxID=1912891 RepID=UPI0029B16850|nr:hypothetical protein [Sphingobium sp.]MDX3911533.1 hypothetical protein [Sphingobium sp.]